jgi:L-fuconolactonase
MLCSTHLARSRLMIGSDWPVCTLAAEYTSVMKVESDYISRLSVDEQHAILEKNPIDFYSIRTLMRAAP